MPPLSYVIFHAWALVFGNSETSIRLASLCGSLIGLFALAAAMRRLAPTMSGIVVLGIYALSLSYIHYSVETRTYPFVVAATSLILYAIGRYIDATHASSRRNWLIVLIGLNVISLYLHYTSLIFAIAVFGAIGIVDLIDRRSVLPAIIGLVIMGAATVPLVPLVSAGLKVKTALLVTEAQDLPRFFARLFASRARCCVCAGPGSVDCCQACSLCNECCCVSFTASEFHAAPGPPGPNGVSLVCLCTGWACRIVRHSVVGFDIAQQHAAAPLQHLAATGFRIAAHLSIERGATVQSQSFTGQQHWLQ